MGHLLRVTLVLAGLFLVSCSDSLSWPPFYGAPLTRSATGLIGVDVTLSADRVVIAAGDSVHFTVTATNRSSVRVQLGEQCGPSMDVAVLAPTGREQSALMGDRASDLYLPSARGFLCRPRRESNGPHWMACAQAHRRVPRPWRTAA